MRAVSLGAILEVVIRGEADGQVTLSFFHYRINNVTPDSDGTALATGFMNLFNAIGGVADRYMDCCSNEFTATKITAQWVYPTRYTAQEFTPVTFTGAVLEQMLPSNVSVELLKRTHLTGRTQRGPLHMPGVPTSFIADSQLTVAADAAYGALAGVLGTVYTLATDEEFEPVIFHRDLPATSPTILEAVVKPVARIIRRRTVGVGI